MTGGAWTSGATELVVDGGPGARTALVLEGTHPASSIASGLSERGWTVWRSSAPLVTTAGLDLVVSFGYRHIIPGEVLEERAARVVNLHISYLPFNRGAHPGFWCFFDGTPCGVSVHEIDAGLDTGPVLARRLIEIDPSTTTFDGAYWRLREEVERLFWEILDPMLADEIRPVPQIGVGTEHRAAELPASFLGWDSRIGPEIERLLTEKRQESARFLSIIDEIEQVRRTNNVNWMDLLRLAFAEAPERARAIVRRINSDDQRISDLLDSLGREPEGAPE